MAERRTQNEHITDGERSAPLPESILNRHSGDVPEEIRQMAQREVEAGGHTEPWQPGDSFRHNLDSPDEMLDLAETGDEIVSDRQEEYEEELNREEPRQNVDSGESLLGHCSNLVGYVLTSRPPLVLVLIAVIALWGLPKTITLTPPSADSPVGETVLPPFGGELLGTAPVTGEPLTVQYTSEEIDEFKRFVATEMDEFVAPGADGENTLEIIYDLPGGEWVQFKAIIKSDLQVKLLYKDSSVKNPSERKLKTAKEAAFNEVMIQALSNVATKRLELLAKDYATRMRYITPEEGVIYDSVELGK